jgi:ABC-type uncharacterized transport system ATPase subunit
MTDSTADIVLELQGVTKRFPGILANDQVDLTLRRGEILALLGENGAGKSTLMNIVYGLYHPDEGDIRIKGESVHFTSPREAIHSGIGMVHQHFQLIPVMTVAENVTLGEENTKVTAGEQPAKSAAQVNRLANDLPTARVHLLELAWGGLWRLLTVVLAIGLGLLIGVISQNIAFVIGIHLVNGPQFNSFQFDKLPMLDKALMAFNVLYPDNPGTTQALLWSPLLIAAIAGAGLMFLMGRHALRSWTGLSSPLDRLIDNVVEWLGILFTIRDTKSAAKQVRELSERYGLAVDPDAVIEQLPVGLQQRVEIVKALYRHADILILDEPTAVLTPQESQELFNIMRTLASQGVSIIFITHKLKEVLSIADRVMVMRTGRVVGSARPAESTEASLASLMVGREVVLRVPKGLATPGAVVLTVENLSAIDDRKAPALDHVQFEVRAGEVLGVAGVQGNGQTELVEVLTGLRNPTNGVFSIESERFTQIRPRQLIHHGGAHIPEDRQRYGMVSSYSVADNLILNTYNLEPYATSPSLRQLPFIGGLYLVIFGAVFGAAAALWGAVGWPAVVSLTNLADPELNPRTTPGPFLLAAILTIIFTVIAGLVAVLVASRVTAVVHMPAPAEGGLTVNRATIDSHGTALINEYDIRTPSPMVGGGTLSGGNQQKMVVAREFSRKPKLLIASQPTRGIDVGSIEFIHRRIVQQRDAGAAVLLVSAELDEILALSDRIAVMYRGKIVATLDAASVTREQLGLLMAGVTSESSNAAVA